MNQDIIQQLKKLKKVRPASGFQTQTRLLILATPVAKRSIFTLPWALAGSLAAIVLVIASLVSLNSLNKPAISSFPNPEDIGLEFDNLSINIQLQEISYRQSVNEVIASALDEISDINPRYLKQSLLENELESFDINGALERQSQINELLDKIIEK